MAPKSEKVIPSNLRAKTRLDEGIGLKIKEKGSKLGYI